MYWERKGSMLRFAGNRWRTFILALFLCAACVVAQPGRARADWSPMDPGSPPTPPPDPGAGDPDWPGQGKAPKPGPGLGSRDGTGPRTVGDASARFGFNSVWMFRIRVAAKIVIRAYWIRF